MDRRRKTYFEIQLDRHLREDFLPEFYYVRIRQSKAFMEKYLAEKIELENIASSAFMSRYHFIRVFKRVYGISPRQFLRDLRIHRSKELLKQGVDAHQVCIDVGYESLPTFSNVFKKATGYPPAAFQQLNKSNPG